MMNSDGEHLCLAMPECARRGGSASCGAGDIPSIPAAGDFWNEHAVVSGVSSGSVMSCPDGGNSGDGCVGGPSSAGACTSRAASVTYVLNSESGPAESAALQCLKDACDAAGCRMDVVHFGKLDFGEVAVLDQFYNAGETQSWGWGWRAGTMQDTNCSEVHGAEMCPSYNLCTI